MNEPLVELLFDLLRCGLISSALASLFLFAVRRRVGVGGFAVGTAILAGLVYLANPAHHVYSFHGFWHTSVVYEIMERGLPPEDPIFAGAPLLYSWGDHWIAALLCSAFALTPATAFSTMNLLALVATIVLLFDVAQRLGIDRESAYFSVALPIFGITCLNFGPIARLAAPYLPFWMEFRGTPPGAQFTHMTGASLGILCFVLGLHATARIFAAGTRRDRLWAAAALLLAVFAAGFFYPLQHPPLAAGAALAAVLVAARNRSRDDVEAAATVLGAVAIGTLLLLPYFRMIATGKSHAAHLGPVPNWPYATGNVYRYLATVGPIAVVLLWQRSAIASYLRERRTETTILVSFLIAPAGCFLVLAAPEFVQYKALMLSCVATGILAGVALGSLYAWQPLLAFAVIVPLWVPMAADLRMKLAGDWSVTDPYRKEGRYLVHADADQQALYTWLATQTSAQAAIVDSYLTVPVFARKPLFTAVDLRRSRIRGPRPHDGWGVPPMNILRHLNGHPDPEIYLRNLAVLDLYAPDSAISDATIAELAKFAHARDLYVVAREPAERVKLSENPRFVERFEGRAGAIFQFEDRDAR